MHCSIQLTCISHASLPAPEVSVRDKGRTSDTTYDVSTAVDIGPRYIRHNPLCYSHVYCPCVICVSTGHI